MKRTSSPRSSGKRRLVVQRTRRRHFSADHDYIVVYARCADIGDSTLPRTEENDDARYTIPTTIRVDRGHQAIVTARIMRRSGQSYSDHVHPAASRSIRRQARTGVVKKRRRFRRDRHAISRIWWSAKTATETPTARRRLRSLKCKKVVVPPDIMATYKDVGHTQDANEGTHRDT